MSRKQISLDEVVDITEPIRREKQENLGFTINDFLEKHGEKACGACTKDTSRPYYIYEVLHRLGEKTM